MKQLFLAVVISLCSFASVQSFADEAAPISMYGVVPVGIAGNAVVGTTASMTSGGALLTDGAGHFAAIDKGRSIVVKGAGAAGEDLTAAIVSVAKPTQLKLSVPASTSVTNATYAYGTDNTQPIQAALNRFKDKGGVVLIPAGNFLCLGHLTVPDYTTLKGIDGFWCHAGNVDGVPHTYPQDGGSTFWVTEKGATQFIDMMTDSTVEGFCFYYPLQLVSQTIPTPYPWTIEGNSGHRNINIRNVELLNSYQGIRVAGDGNPERVFIDCVSGQPIAMGISLDDIWDICRVNNCHFNPWWSGLNSPTLKWQEEHGIAYDIGKADWSVGVNDMAFGYHTDFYFGRVGGACGTWTNCDPDDNHNAVICGHIDRAIGLTLIGWKCTSIIGPNGVAILVDDCCSGSVTVLGCNFAAINERVLQIGTGNPNVCFANNYIDSWAYKGASSAVYAKSGILRCNDNYFGGNLIAPDVELEPGVMKASIKDNVVSPGSMFNAINGIGDRAGISGNF